MRFINKTKYFNYLEIEIIKKTSRISENKKGNKKNVEKANWRK